MKKTFYLLPALLLFLSFDKPARLNSERMGAIGQSEEYPFSKWNAATMEKANSAKNVSYLSSEEKKVVYYTNLARLNPELFCKTYYAKYIDSTKAKATTFTNSLRHDLTAKYKPMDILTVKEDLTEEALDHARDMGKSGKLGHFTSDGKSYEFRMKKFKGTYASTAEACDYGHQDALSIVIHLLIDEKVAAIEHRKAMLDKNFNYVGVSIQPHKKEKWSCVMDFAR